MLNFRQSVLGFLDWWTLNYASEATLFDDDLNPTFPDDEDRRAETILQWLTDGIHRHRIISPSSLTAGQMRDHVASGRQVYGILNKYDLEYVNNRRNSVAADDALKRQGSDAQHAKVYRMAPVPSISAEQNGTLGWTRMYCLTSRCREDRMQDAWSLMKFLGAKDAEGEYYTARRWFRLRGLGFAYRSLLDDPDIVAQPRPAAGEHQGAVVPRLQDLLPARDPEGPAGAAVRPRRTRQNRTALPPVDRGLELSMRRQLIADWT